MDNNNKYFLYCRKSSESEDRQIQSIEDQVSRLKQLAKQEGLSIVKVYSEAKSAKKPNNRPLFDEMIEKIETGQANGILCWSINRLTRNPIDGGKLSWLLQQGVIKSIKTTDREYQPEDNVLIFNVESGVANQFILDLKKSTQRGMQSKLEKGWLPCMPPLGYLNDKENKIIAKDPERFELVRKMWDLMLTGAYNPSKIVEIANKEWGFTTRRFKKIGGGELTRAGIYKMFSNIFYTGLIEFAGKQYNGQHEAMITIDEYDRVQLILGKKGRPRPQKHQFAFTGAIRCSECGCLYTAEEKKKIAKKTGNVSLFRYYHCTRRSRKIECTQRKAIREEMLESMIEEEISKLTIMPEFLHWALEVLNENNDKEISNRKAIYEMQHKTLVKSQDELDELARMRYRKLIDDEFFEKEKNILEIRINKLKDNLRATEARAENWLELTEKTFHFATYARHAFVTGGLEQKKEILLALGCQPVIKEGKLEITTFEWLKPIQNNYPAIEKEYKRLEPVLNGTAIGSNGKQKEALASIRQRWYPR